MSCNRKKPGGRNHRAVAPEIKAQVLAALLAGQGIEKVAADYELPIGTVKSLKSRMKGETPVATTGEQKADVGELLVEYLRENLETLKYQQRTVFRNSAWLHLQSAAELATLHGVIADKCARLLESMGGDAELGEEPRQP